MLADFVKGPDFDKLPKTIQAGVRAHRQVDAFTDSDFGLGGTNMKGYTVFGSVALSSAVSLGVRWLSASEIAGPPLKNDTIQIDLSGKF